MKKSLVTSIILALALTTQVALANSKSLNQAVRDIKQQTNGRILSADTRNDTHIIKVLLPSGKVRIFKVPAR